MTFAHENMCEAPHRNSRGHSAIFFFLEIHWNAAMRALDVSLIFAPTRIRHSAAVCLLTDPHCSDFVYNWICCGQLSCSVCTCPYLVGVRP